MFTDFLAAIYEVLKPIVVCLILLGLGIVVFHGCQSFERRQQWWQRRQF